MHSGNWSNRRTSLLATMLLAGASVLGAADGQTNEIEQLKAQLAAQQKQLQALQAAIEQQQKALDTAERVAAPAPVAPASLGSVASLSPVIPMAPAAAVALPLPAQAPTAQTTPTNPCEAPAAQQIPAFIRLGDTCMIPIGFMDLTPVWRDKNAGSSMGSNYGSIPYNNTVNGHLSEFRFSPQNSRIGFRFDGNWKGAHFIGYNEFDFNGTSGSNGIAVSNGAFVPRLRLFWADVRKGNVEFLAGQSWSMLVPNRKGISALPGDLFYTNVIDINYVAGLTWTRQPGVRVLYHAANDKVTFGFSAEQADQYAGGSAGGSGITLPSAFSALSNAQLDVAQNVSSGQNILNQPTVTPDFIAKVAFDPSSHFHLDIAGINSNFKIVNPNLLTQHFSKSGGGVELGLNAELMKNFRFVSTNFYNAGDGRYIFGQAPDLIVRSDGSLSLVRSASFIEGFEATVKNTGLYTYWSNVYIARNTALDANGTTKIGYGYAGSANSQNRSINEFTLGFNQTVWRNPRYGAINVMGQYEWLQRNPWYVAIGSPKNTHDNTIYMNIRYTLPGSMPNF